MKECSRRSQALRRPPESIPHEVHIPQRCQRFRVAALTNLCDPAGVRGPVRVRYEPLPGTDLGDLPRVLEAPCP